MEGPELIRFGIIPSVGMARSLYIEAIQEAKTGDFKQAQELIKQGDELFTEGYHSHAKLTRQKTDGEATQMTLLLTYAKDQLMSAGAFEILPQEFMDLYKEIKKQLKIREVRGEQNGTHRLWVKSGICY